MVQHGFHGSCVSNTADVHHHIGCNSKNLFQVASNTKSADVQFQKRMSVKYVKNSSGRGVLLADRTALAALSEKEALLNTVKSLQAQIDNLQERIARLENGKKE